MNLEGKVAVITGSAVRIGRAIALALADAGADICIHYNSSDQAARDTCAEIEQRGRMAMQVSADLSDPVSAAETVFSEVMTELGRADVLVNSASVFENK
ncbi:MAG: SDR family NAD(P)-dependent oxidoreductase, partial [Gimesia chilikensis]